MLKNKIEECREKLISLINTNVPYETALKVSQELDILILQYTKLTLERSKNNDERKQAV